LTLARLEEAGQRLSIGQGGVPGSIFQRFTADVLTMGNESIGLIQGVASSLSSDFI
jgi:hypothetical protein